MNWALKQSTGSASAKVVLLILANRANEVGICWPGYTSIGDQAELHRSTVIRHINHLEKNGFIRVENRPKMQTNLYHLQTDEVVAQCDQSQAATSSGQRLGSRTARPSLVAQRDQGSRTARPKPKDKPKDKPKENPKAENPDWLNLEAWGEFVIHRSELNKPLTDLAAKKVWNKLEGLSAADQQKAVDEAIEKKWITVYPKPAEASRYRDL